MILSKEQGNYETNFETLNNSYTRNKMQATCNSVILKREYTNNGGLFPEIG
jgi:hypothetical protein